MSWEKKTRWKIIENSLYNWFVYADDLLSTNTLSDGLRLDVFFFNAELYSREEINPFFEADFHWFKVECINTDDVTALCRYLMNKMREPNSPSERQLSREISRDVCNLCCKKRFCRFTS